jgi:TOBE domain
VYLGGKWDCELTLAGGLALRAELPATSAITPAAGDRLTVVVPPEDVIVLPA